MNPNAQTDTREHQPLADLIKELRNETTMLLRQEVALAKSEISEKTAKFSRNAGYMAAGGAVALAGAVVLLLAVAWLLSWGLEAMGVSSDVAVWLGPLVVGLVVVGIGYGLVQKAIHTFKHEPIVPQKTIDSIKEDKQWLQNKVS